MGSELAQVLCALAALVLPVVLAWFIVSWQGSQRRDRDRH
jgi:hypothetical protein